MKNKLGKILLLFLSFIVTVFLSVFSLFITIDWIYKILIFILGIILSGLEFIYIHKINQNIPNEIIIEHEELNEAEQTTKTYDTKHILCPKCYKPFDGKKCFYYGFEKNEIC